MRRRILLNMNEEFDETRVVAKYNVTSTTEPTTISYADGRNSGTSCFASIEIDGVVQSSVVSAYTFSTLGEHTVKYTLVSLESIGSYAFYGCYRMTSVTIPNSIMYIGSYAFYQCGNLKSINSNTDGVFNLPSGFKQTSLCSFCHCYGLKSLIIPSGATDMSSQSFYNCRSLKTITCMATKNPIVFDNTFYSVSSNGTLYVPKGSSDYQRYWLNTSAYYLGYYNWRKVEI